MELFAAIRFDWQRHRMPVRALAPKYDVHRRTVRQAIGIAVIGLILLILAVSAAQGLEERRSGRPRHGSQPDY